MICTRCWLPRRELLDVVLGAVGEAEPLEVARHRGPGRRGAEAAEPAEVDELVEHRLLGVEAALLGHVAEAAAGRAAVIGRPSQSTSPPRGRQDAHDHAHRRRLARHRCRRRSRSACRPATVKLTSSTARISPKVRLRSPQLDVGRRAWSGEAVPVVAHAAHARARGGRRRISRRDGSSASPGRMSPAS